MRFKLHVLRRYLHRLTREVPIHQTGFLGHGKFPACSCFRHREGAEETSLILSFPLATPCLFLQPFVVQHLLESAEKHETRGNMSPAREINAKFVLQEIG